jgi:hypothetical protein
MKDILQNLHETPHVDPPDGLHNETIAMIKEDQAKLQKPDKASAPLKSYTLKSYFFAAASAVATFILVCVISSGLGLYSANYSEMAQPAVSAPGSYADYSVPENATEAEPSESVQKEESSVDLSSPVIDSNETSEYDDSGSQTARSESSGAVEEYGAYDSANVLLDRFENVNNLSSDSADTITHFYITLTVNDLKQVKEKLQSFPGWTLSSSYAETDASVSQRVGIEDFETAKDLLRGLGNVQSESETVNIAQADLTELYARLTKKEEEKSRLLDILAKAADLDVMLLVEQRLNAVNNEYDNIYTSMRDIANDTSSPYIQINLKEEAAAEVRPDVLTFGARVKNSFVDSANGMIEFGQNVLIGLAKMIVPLGVVAVGVFVCWLIAMAIVKRGQ